MAKGPKFKKLQNRKFIGICVMFIEILISMNITSCTETDLSMTANDTPETISFSYADTRWEGWEKQQEQTKGVVYDKLSLLGSTSTTGSGIGIFAFYQSAKSNGYPTDFNNHLGTPRFMYNQKLSSTTTDNVNYTFSYEPQKYWPNTPNDQLSFFAYAPYKAGFDWDDMRITSNLTGDKITRTFPIYSWPKDQIDYLWADPVLNVKRDDPRSESLSFDFKHVCAQVGFKIAVCKNSSGTPVSTNWTDTGKSITVKSVKLEGVYSSFNYRVTSNGIGGWDDPEIFGSGSQTVELNTAHSSFQNNVINSTTWATAGYRQLNTNDSFLMLAPQTMSQQEIFLTVTYTVKTSSSSVDKTSILTFSSASISELKPGKCIIFNILISPNM